MESLANADEKGRIELVKEVYIDYFVADPDLFVLKTPSISELGEEEFKASQKQFLKQAEESLFAVCLALRRLPNITYSFESKLGKKLAERLSARLEREYTQNHKDFLQESLDLVVFDRREDPLTPLVYNWSYSSMVHEFVGIENNAVTVGDIKDKDNRPQVFARQCDDSFLDNNWNKNFGEFTTELGTELQRMYKEKNVAVKSDDLEAMQKALDKLPDLSKETARLRKHSAIIQALGDFVTTNEIYSVSQLQQDIITENNKQQQLKDLLQMFLKKGVRSIDKLKLAMIYCLKYSDDSERVSGIQRAAQAQNLPVVSYYFMKEDIKAILEYSASSKRANADLFTVANMFEKVSTNILSKFKVAYSQQG